MSFSQKKPNLSRRLGTYYAKGVEAGELALGPQGFKEYAGHFWGFLETRPYMRARAGLASTLVQLGDVEGALAHYRDMLKLNPNDNQGIRYVLAGCLLKQDNYSALKELLAAYEDGSAFWLYTRALVAFRERRVTSRPQRWSRMPGRRTSMCLPSWPARSPR